MVVGKGKGHMHDRQRYSEKLESIIAHFNYCKTFRDGWFIISFIHAPEKIAKQLVKTLVGRWWKNGRGTYVC